MRLHLLVLTPEEEAATQTRWTGKDGRYQATVSPHTDVNISKRLFFFLSIKGPEDLSQAPRPSLPLSTEDLQTEKCQLALLSQMRL